MSYLFGVKHDIRANEFKNPDSLEQNKYKPYILDWLCQRYNIEKYNHSFRDGFISFNIWSNQLSIRFDFRCEEQTDLFNKLPNEIKGTPQKGTGTMVNLKTLYFKLSDIIEIGYPEILKQVLFHTDKSKDNDGDDFYVYNYKVHLSDGTIIYHSNQKKDEPIDMDYTFPCTIQTRAFLKYLIGL